MSNVRGFIPPKRIPASISDRAEKNDGYASKADTIDDPTPRPDTSCKEPLELSVQGRSIGFPVGIRLVKDQNGKPGIVESKNGLHLLSHLGSPNANRLLNKILKKHGYKLTKKQLKELNEELAEHAEEGVEKVFAHNRVAPVPNGIEIYLADEDGTVFRVNRDGTEDVSENSLGIFNHDSNRLPLVKPAKQGNIEKLYPYLNVSEEHRILVIAFISYTLAYVKAPGTNYVNLVIKGEQGSGKTSATNLILQLLDPTVSGIQSFPNKQLDLAIASQNSHVLAFDNMRNVRAQMSDILCQLSSRGSLVLRALYTNDEMTSVTLHAPMIINGIHDVVNQPDLAQRCITVETLIIPEKDRRRISDINQQLEEDLPEIFQGLLLLISGVFKHLPKVKVTHPERMIDFSYWLAAMEIVMGVPVGDFQKIYSQSVKSSQLDTLMGNTLAATIIEFTDDLYKEGIFNWSGTPSELLEELSLIYSGSKYSRDWPQNAIALSKRLNGLKASLLSQGIEIELSRGKKRTITIKNVEAINEL